MESTGNAPATVEQINLERKLMDEAFQRICESEYGHAKAAGMLHGLLHGLMFDLRADHKTRGIILDSYARTLDRTREESKKR